MENQPQNPEFMNHPERFHPCKLHVNSENSDQPYKGIIELFGFCKGGTS